MPTRARSPRRCRAPARPRGREGIRRVEARRPRHPRSRRPHRPRRPPRAPAGLVELGGGLLRRRLVDVGGGDDLVDRVDDLVPTAPDHRLDLGPALAAASAAEASMPAPKEPSTGLPLKNFVTADSSQTEPMDDTMASVRCSVATESSVGFSAASSWTPIRSCCRSSAGSKRCGDRVGQRRPRGVVGEVVVAVGADEGGQVGHRFERVEVLVLAEEPCHSSPASRQRGAHNVYRSPLVNPRRIGTMSAAMRHSLTTGVGRQVIQDGWRAPQPALDSC